MKRLARLIVVLSLSSCSSLLSDCSPGARLLTNKEVKNLDEYAAAVDGVYLSIKCEVR
jgi:hypothetical protein